MALQNENPIYKFLKENNLTQKSEVDFVNEYSNDSNKQKELFNFMRENKLTYKDEVSFVGTYFPKQAEVSPQRPAGTSPTSVGPTQITEESAIEQQPLSTRPTENLSGQSSAGSFDALSNPLTSQGLPQIPRTEVAESFFERKKSGAIARAIKDYGSEDNSWEYTPMPGYEVVEGRDNKGRLARGLYKRDENGKLVMPGDDLGGSGLIKEVSGRSVAEFKAEQEYFKKNYDYFKGGSIIHDNGFEIYQVDDQMLADNGTTIEEVRSDIIKNRPYVRLEYNGEVLNEGAQTEMDTAQSSKGQIDALVRGLDMARFVDSRTGKVDKIGKAISTFGEALVIGSLDVVKGAMGLPNYLDSLVTDSYNGLAEWVESLSGKDLSEFKASANKDLNAFIRDLAVKKIDDTIKEQQAYGIGRYGSGDIIDTGKSGNINATVNKFASGFGQMLPFTGMLMATSGMGTGITALAGTSVLAPNRYMETANNPNMSPLGRHFYSLAGALSETGLEALGNRFLMEPLQSAIKSYGKKQATDALAKGLRKSMGRMYYMTPPAVELTAELATTATDNVLAKGTGLDRDRKITDGFGDTTILSLAMSGGMMSSTGAIQSIANKKLRKEAQVKLAENEEYISALKEGGLSDASRRKIERSLQENIEEINSYIEREIDRKYSLSPRQQDIVERLESQRNSFAEVLDDATVPDSVKEIMQQNIDSINDQIEEITTTTIEGDLSTRTPEQIDQNIEVMREASPTMVDTRMGDVEISDSTFDVISKAEGNEAISNSERVQSVSDLNKKIDDLKRLKRDSERVHTTEEIDIAISGLEDDINMISDIARADLKQVSPGQVFSYDVGDGRVRSEVKSTSINDDGSIDVTFTDGTVINSENLNVQTNEVTPQNQEVDQVSSETTVEVNDTPDQGQVQQTEIEERNQFKPVSQTEAQTDIESTQIQPQQQTDEVQIQETVKENEQNPVRAEEVQEGTASTEDASTRPIRESYERLTEGMTPEQIEADPDLVRMRDRISGEPSQPSVKSKPSVKPKTESKPKAEKSETTKAGDSLRDLAKKIRQGKIAKPDDLRNLKSSALFDTAWDGALETVATALEGTASLSDAIQSGVNNLKQSDWYKSLSKGGKARAEEALIESVENSVGDIESDTQTGEKSAQRKPSEPTSERRVNTPKNDRLAEARAKYGFGERVKPNVKGYEQSAREARKAIRDRKIHINDLFDKVRKGDALNDWELIVATEYLNMKEDDVAELSNDIENNIDETPSIFKDLASERDDAMNEILKTINLIEQTGTISGRALSARKNAVIRDLSLGGMLSEKRKAVGGRRLTAREREDINKRFREANNKRKEVEKKYRDVSRELDRAKADIALIKERHKVELEYRKNKDRAGSRKEHITDIQQRRIEAKEDLKKSIQKMTNLGFAVTVENQVKADLEFLNALGRLTATYFQEALSRTGVNVNHDAIINNITRDLKDIYPNITKDQVMQLIDSLDNDTRPTLVEISAEIKTLKGIASEAKTANMKNSLKNQIKDLQKRIDNKDYRKAPAILEKRDAELRKLQKDLNNMQYDFRLELERDKLRNRTKWQKFYGILAETTAVPRAIMATADLSAALRQGIFAFSGHPRTGWRAFKEMHNFAFSEDYYNEWKDNLRDTEVYDLAMDSGLAITDVGPNVQASLREEQFMSKLLDRIPGVNKITGFSERGYSGFLNKMRIDLFSQASDQLFRDGLNPVDNAQDFKAVATYINATTGRGPTPEKMNETMNNLSTAFFAPRLISSRLYLLLGGPLLSGSAQVRKMYARDLMSFISFGVTTTFLAGLAGADISFDDFDDEDKPLNWEGFKDEITSTDFMNIRWGDRRYDVWGGFGQYVKFFNRFATGQTVSSSGRRTIIDPFDEEFVRRAGAQNRLTLTARFLQSKGSPMANFTLGAMSGENYMGDPFSFGDELKNMLMPLVWQDTWESWSEYNEGPVSLLTTGLPAFYGMGVQNWKSNSFLKNGSDDKLIDLMTKKKVNTMFRRRSDISIIDSNTGKKREPTEEEYKQYTKEWGEYVTSDLEENFSKYDKMPKAEFEKKFDSIKRKATEYARKSLSGISTYDTKINVGGQSISLDPDQISRRVSIMNEYKKRNARDYNQYVRDYISDGKSEKEAKIQAQKDFDSEARSYSRDEMINRGYVDIED